MFVFACLVSVGLQEVTGEADDQFSVELGAALRIMFDPSQSNPV